MRIRIVTEGASRPQQDAPSDRFAATSPVARGRRKRRQGPGFEAVGDAGNGHGLASKRSGRTAGQGRPAILPSPREGGAGYSAATALSIDSPRRCATPAP
jgi:hypothetical protein